MSIFLRINSSLRVGGKNPISRLRNGQEIAVELPRPRETRSRPALPWVLCMWFLGCSVPFIFIKVCFLLLYKHTPRMSSVPVLLGPSSSSGSSPAENFSHHITTAYLLCPSPPVDSVPLRSGTLVLLVFPQACDVLLSQEELLTKNTMNEQVHKPR